MRGRRIDGECRKTITCRRIAVVQTRKRRQVSINVNLLVGVIVYVIGVGNVAARVPQGRRKEDENDRNISML